MRGPDEVAVEEELDRILTWVTYSVERIAPQLIAPTEDVTTHLKLVREQVIRRSSSSGADCCVELEEDHRELPGVIAAVDPEEARVILAQVAARWEVLSLN